MRGFPLLRPVVVSNSTGRPRTVPLSYLAWGEALVVIGSKGGAPRHPNWYLNLEAEPAVEVQIGREHRRLRARRATDEEAGRLWPEVLVRAPGYGRFRAKTSREIPLILLEGARALAAPETR